MAIHTELAIYKACCDLIALAFKVQQQMPRGLKRTLGERINQSCIDMLSLVAFANSSTGEARASYLTRLLTLRDTLTALLRAAHDEKWVSHALWGSSVLLLDSIGKQGGGWQRSARNKAPAA